MTDPAPTAATIAEVLRDRAGRTPDAPAFVFLPDGESVGPRLTYAGLDREARAVAAALRAVAGPGDRALLLYAPGLPFVAAFYGCQYAGVVPVPTYPPRPDRLAHSWEALAAVAADCRPRAVLTDRLVGQFVPKDGGPVAALAGVPRIVTDDLDPGLAAGYREPPADPDGLALLQYTSGSTAAPKGVMVTHRNLMHNQAVIRAGCEHDGPGVGVTWLPPYHDLGLIGGVVQNVYHGAACYMMSPTVMLRDPSLWLRAISAYRADTSGGPNFAYDFCARRVTAEQKAGLDLSHWSVAAVGAEPIQPDTLDRFAEAFGPCGFRREAFFPCYGLAEGTLFVTAEAKSNPPRVLPVDPAALEAGRAAPADGPAARLLVGCGGPRLGQEVRIVDPDSSLPKPDGEVGEVWVRGPSVAAGYWGRPDETAATFHARLADTGAGPYLRTGDLGFVRDGDLFVTGRIKDLIVIRGRNHYPQDIERTAQAAHPGLRPDCGAAFEVVRDGQPRLVIAQEVDRRCRDLDPARAAGDVRQAVAERHDVLVAEVVFLEYGGIPKTSSGKVRRHACRAGYETGGLRLWTRRTG